MILTFQSTPHTQAVTIVCDEKQKLTIFQSTPHTQAVTISLRVTFKMSAISIHTAYASGDWRFIFTVYDWWNFNPHRIRKRWPIFKLGLTSITAISIHTAYASGDNQSGVRCRKVAISIHTAYASGDLYSYANSKAHAISIHTAYASGDFCTKNLQKFSKDFNPHRIRKRWHNG